MNKFQKLSMKTKKDLKKNIKVKGHLHPPLFNQGKRKNIKNNLKLY